MEILMRAILLLLFSTILALAGDSFITKAHARIVPKIMALDTSLTSKSDPSKKVFAVVYDSNQKSEAQSIADEINKIYNGKVAALYFSALLLS